MPDRRRSRDLRPHPRQNEVFDSLNEAELDALAASIEKHGLQHPVHITPDGIILSGHQRVAAAQKLGWVMIDVIVRFDLVAQGDIALGEFFVEENLSRRQLDPIGMARAYRELQRIEKLQRPRCRTKNGAERQDLRDRLAKRFGKSGRQLDRMLRLLELPRAVQRAISLHTLPVSLAENLFKLSPDRREEAASAIEAGGNPRNVIQRLVPTPPSNKPRRTRVVVPGAAEAREHLLTVLSFIRGDLDGYIEYVVRKPGSDRD
jgi:ParB/RepB/Spo0J family partition protein